MKLLGHTGIKSKEEGEEGEDGGGDPHLNRHNESTNCYRQQGVIGAQRENTEEQQPHNKIKIRFISKFFMVTIKIRRK